MQYFIYNTLGDINKRNEFCFTRCKPTIITSKTFSLKIGKTLKSIYPEDPYEVEMVLREKHPGIKLPSMIGNTSRYLMVNSEVVEVLKQYNIGDVEFWPFTLINHKGREHSRDYCFVNPIGGYDSLDYELSEIDKDSNGVTIGIDKIVLDNKKLKDAPDMFRIFDTYSFAFNEPLKEVFEKDFTNFVFEKAEQV